MDQTSNLWEHLKTKGLYEVVRIEALLEADLTPVVVYQSISDGRVWVRPTSEFMDGRFRNLTLDEARLHKAV